MTLPNAEGTEGLPRPGDLFEGKYRIERLIGKGGMGAVLGAHHEMLDQKVAIKFLLGDIAGNQEAVMRFRKEAQAAAKIKGEHVCQVTEAGVSSGGLPYMVMELLDGMDLAQILETRGPLGVEEATDYVLQALEAIAQAHGKGIVHRDLKPANLFLSKREDGYHVIKVLDFGISKASNPFSQTGNHNLTSTKSMLGSPLYMSPEQLRSAKNVDQRADIWSIGVILFELLTGRVPFNGESLGELFVSILESPTPRVSQFRQDIPQVLDDAIFRCLQKQLDQRFTNVAELAYQLAPCAPARAQVSIDRIQGALGRAQDPSFSGPRPPMASHAGPLTGSHSGVKQLPIPSGSQGGQQQPQSVQTQDALAQSVGGVPQNKPPIGLIVGGIVGFLVLAGVAIGVGYAMSHRGDKDTIGTQPTQTATTTAATTATPTATETPTATQTAVPSTTASVTVPPTVTTGAKPPVTVAGTTHTATGKPSVSAPPATASTTAPTNTGFNPFAAGRH